MRPSDHHHFILLLLLLLTFIQTLCNGADVINTTLTLRDVDNGETLISSDGSFELGFFSPGDSKNRYLGIWYRKITAFTVVWVANRDSPLTGGGGGAVLKVVHPGMLTLVNATNSVVWSSNRSRVAQSPVAQLLDTGNLVVREANDDNPDNYLWQSFDEPTDTLLPGMKLGHLATGHENYLSSWKSSDDPSTGSYSLHIDPTGYPQMILKKDSGEVSRAGPWNGFGFSGFPGLKNNSVYTFDLIIRGKEVYYHYNLLDRSTITRLVMNRSGITQRWAWVDRSQGWVTYLTAGTDNCDTYNMCGAAGSCNLNSSPICDCLPKFTPKFPGPWAAGGWKDGCVRRTPLDCRTDGFVKYSDLKLPDARNSWFNTSMSLPECKLVCLKNCNCTAYTNLDVRNGGSGCLLWFEDLLDLKQVYGGGQDIFIRLASSELDNITVGDSRKSKKRTAIIASFTSLAAAIVLMALCLGKKRVILMKLRKGDWRKEDDKDLELPLVELHKISKATDNFCESNKLGEGGFGPVYKGTMEDGQEVAVKRLSKTSLQGLYEFKNEVVCIARLQHRNLVKLLGCCIQGEEKMLIYEYMPNKSLDLILFDETRSKLLYWPKRFQIITGIARGLMYLHQDSRLRIIHRDLKLSNILLDADMNPKISDFGMARIFGGNETEANTNKVVGTYGYMSPEYTAHGLFSVKSDVFSFGVIVLEVLSGQRNRGFSHKDHPHSLLGHVWVLHKEDKSLEVVVESVLKSCSSPDEVVRVIQIGLLCVQAYPEDRPTMSSVVYMLENDVALPPARQPGFFMEGGAFVNDSSVSTKGSSKNEITVTMLEPR
ncbi:G-type lectin S-receptor-like serine/threonine-protein kinase At4g27290 isoform X2 [Andrographis paniculata]|uniref:G-type lectin S-receptor-like serine/threonine-protein kinase At4g27290 isoform X2 n=1 Tax=Andrographis paniculata TaxID=175694 RepID=UPI0021E98793|nr:G-type lectin S-receptor-like serine/threonine-protein kinase At4g27290 isoform X2 [Andrographis paniculata]